MTVSSLLGLLHITRPTNGLEREVQSWKVDCCRLNRNFFITGKNGTLNWIFPSWNTDEPASPVSIRFHSSRHCTSGGIPSTETTCWF